MSKGDIHSKVKQSLSDPKNEKVVSQILLKMGRVMEKKRLLQNQPPVMVYDNRIWVGNYSFANNREFLESNDIRTVISCLQLPPSLSLPQVQYKRFEFKDGNDQRFQLYVVDFIQYVLAQGGHVFVHCFAGRSRSVALVVALLMCKERKSYDQALELIKSVYSIAAPNPFFEQALRGMQKKLHQITFQENKNLLDGDIPEIVTSPTKSKEQKEEKVASLNEINLLEMDQPKQIVAPIDLLAETVSANNDINDIIFEDSQNAPMLQFPNIIHDFEANKNELTNSNDMELLDLHHDQLPIVNKEETSETQQPLPQANNTPEESTLLSLDSTNLSDDNLSFPTISKTETVDLLEVEQKVEKKVEKEEQQFVDSTDFTQKKVKHKKKKR